MHSDLCEFSLSCGAKMSVSIDRGPLKMLSMTRDVRLMSKQVI
jgi:hypothetical protein